MIISQARSALLGVAVVWGDETERESGEMLTRYW